MLLEWPDLGAISVERGKGDPHNRAGMKKKNRLASGVDLWRRCNKQTNCFCV